MGGRHVGEGRYERLRTDLRFVIDSHGAEPLEGTQTHGDQVVGANVIHDLSQRGGRERATRQGRHDDAPVRWAIEAGSRLRTLDQRRADGKSSIAVAGQEFRSRNQGTGRKVDRRHVFRGVESVVVIQVRRCRRTRIGRDEVCRVEGKHMLRRSMRSSIREYGASHVRVDGAVVGKRVRW